MANPDSEHMERESKSRWDFREAVRRTITREPNPSHHGDRNLMRISLFTALAAGVVGILCRLFSIGGDQTATSTGLMLVAVVYGTAALIDGIRRSRISGRNAPTEAARGAFRDTIEGPHRDRTYQVDAARIH